MNSRFVSAANVVDFPSFEDRTDAIVWIFREDLRRADQALMDASISLREIEANIASMNALDICDMEMLGSLYLERFTSVTGRLARINSRLLTMRAEDPHDSL